MKKLKSNKGITMITLIVTIIVILILTSVTISSSFAGLDYRKYKLMCADVEMLEDEILFFYRQYGELPIGDEAIGLPSEIDNGHIFYEINMNKLSNITLNYGESNDIFIVDSETFEVYYKNGIEYQDVIYYTD